MADILEKIREEWSVIRGAPWSVGGLALVVAGVVWFFSTQINSATISGKDATIESQKAQIDSYKDKLSGATPDEAKSRIDRLEARLAIIEPRQISEDKIKIMSDILRTATSENHPVVIEADMGCSDCAKYSEYLRSAFPQPPWTVQSGMVGGPSKSSAKGLAVFATNAAAPSADAIMIGNALKAVGIAFEFLSESALFYDPSNPTKPRAAAGILITSRIVP